MWQTYYVDRWSLRGPRPLWAHSRVCTQYLRLLKDNSFKQDELISKFYFLTFLILTLFFLSFCIFYSYRCTDVCGFLFRISFSNISCCPVFFQLFPLLFLLFSRVLFFHSVVFFQISLCSYPLMVWLVSNSSMVWLASNSSSYNFFPLIFLI